MALVRGIMKCVPFQYRGWMVTDEHGVNGEMTIVRGIIRCIPFHYRGWVVMYKRGVDGKVALVRGIIGCVPFLAVHPFLCTVLVGSLILGIRGMTSATTPNPPQPPSQRPESDPISPSEHSCSCGPLSGSQRGAPTLTPPRSPRPSQSTL
jgi:putative component of membrane protein insertase Oxa1/YidC/SpoIIIJ protein YidD